MLVLHYLGIGDLPIGLKVLLEVVLCSLPAQSTDKYLTEVEERERETLTTLSQLALPWFNGGRIHWHLHLAFYTS